MYEDNRTILPSGLLSQATRKSSVTPNRIEVGFINKNATQPAAGHVNIDQAQAEADRKQKEAQNSGGLSVICTRYYLLGFMNPHTYRLDNEYGTWLKASNPDFYAWYLAWGTKAANRLNYKTWYNSLLVYALWPLVDHCSREMSIRIINRQPYLLTISPKAKGSKLGAMIMTIGEYAFKISQRLK